MKFGIAIEDAMLDSHESKPFPLQIPQTVDDDDERSSMQKEFSRLIKNWWWIFDLKFWCSWGNWENWKGFRSGFGEYENLLWLDDDYEYILQLNPHLITLINQTKCN